MPQAPIGAAALFALLTYEIVWRALQARMAYRNFLVASAKKRYHHKEHKLHKIGRDGELHYTTFVPFVPSAAIPG